MLPQLLAAALAAGAAPDASVSAAPGAPPEGEVAPLALAAEPAPLPAPAVRLRSLGGSRQELGFGYHATTFWSHESSHYTFHSLGLAYLGSYGERGPFLHAAGFIPIQARQDGRVYAANDPYGARLGADLLVGWQRRWRPSARAEAELGPGLHGAALWIPGRKGYRDFSAMPLGVGVSGVVRWRTDRHLGRWPFRVGGFGMAATDLYDPLRSNDLRAGFTFLAGVVAGVDDP